jgi:hypothetical protein
MSRHGVRIEWNAVPRSVREAVDLIAGSPVVTATNIAGGFSPGPAARCVLANGERVFVKAVGAELNGFAPTMHRREAHVMAALPSDAPAPVLLGVHDDGDWVALVIADVDGRMPLAPLSSADTAAILRVVDVLASIPAPAGIAAVGTNEVGGGRPYRFRLIAEGDPTIAPPDAWTVRHLERLVELEARWLDAAAGSALLHGDLRSDNVLIAAERTYVVDWPSAAVGAPWVDLVGLLPALHLDGAPPPWELFDRHPVGRLGDPDAVDAYLTGLLGYFTHEALSPPPAGLPTLRAFQAAQATIAREWLSRRRGLL